MLYNTSKHYSHALHHPKSCGTRLNHGSCCTLPPRRKSTTAVSAPIRSLICRFEPWISSPGNSLKFNEIPAPPEFRCIFRISPEKKSMVRICRAGYFPRFPGQAGFFLWSWGQEICPNGSGMYCRTIKLLPGGSLKRHVFRSLMTAPPAGA